MGGPEMAPQPPHGGSGRPGEAVAPLDIDPVRASFDRIAERYAADFADELTRKPWDVERLRRFGAACRPGPVLDVGCGAAGHVGRFVADLGSRPDRAVIGVDFSERSVILARRLNPTLSFVAADVRALPVADGVCAGIVAFYSLIYGGDEATAGVLGALRGGPRGGGRGPLGRPRRPGAPRLSPPQGPGLPPQVPPPPPPALAPP